MEGELVVVLLDVERGAKDPRQARMGVSEELAEGPLHVVLPHGQFRGGPEGPRAVAPKEAHA